MRIKISHHTTYSYTTPIKSLIQVLRLTPRDHEGQHVLKWRINIDVDGHLRAGEDPLGNITHALSIEGPVDTFTVSVDGEVETTNTHGILRGLYETFPPHVFLRETPLTALSAEMRDFADKALSNQKAPLDSAHNLLQELNNYISFDTTPTHVATTAAEAFAMRKGVCQDLSHIFIAAMRHKGFPARYVSGYFKRIDGVVDQEAGHAWAEVLLDDLGWVGFDPANGICTTDAHVRIAIGLDYLGAAPVRGNRYGGGLEMMDVSLHVAEAAQ
jgi:transglutaminase-like putative cysteine protease